ncbi:MAG: MFS transporter [Rhodospirillales bacterium]|nr:MFS transporter [Rhodospirillales bacterium]
MGADVWRLLSAGFAIFTVRWGETLAASVFVLDRTHSPFLVAMMTMLRLLPMGLFGAPIGAWAERVPRRTALLVTILGMGSASAALAVLGFAGRLTVWEVGVASFVNGLGWAADNPVRRVAMGEFVGSDRMGRVMSFDVAATTGSRMLGPVIGGALLAVGGIGAVFATSVALYATALWATLATRFVAAPRSRAGTSVLAGIAEGLRAARRNRALMGVLVVTVIYNIFAWPFTSMVPVIARGDLRLGTAATGVLASMDGVGAFLGALLLAAFLRRRHFALAYIGGVLSYTGLLMLFALMGNPVWAGAVLLATGLGGAGFSVMQATLVYLLAPAEMRGRMLGVLSVCIGAGPIGFVGIGWAADMLGARAATLGTGALGLAALAITFPFWRDIGPAARGDPA